MQIAFASVVEDVLQQHSKRLCDIDLASRKAEEACMIIYSLTPVFLFFQNHFPSVGIRILFSTLSYEL